MSKASESRLEEGIRFEPIRDESLLSQAMDLCQDSGAVPSGPSFRAQAQYLTWIAALRGDRLIGAICFECPDEEGQVVLSAIARVPDEAGRGVGKGLLRSLESDVNGDFVIVGTVERNNESAVCFYKREGFTLEPNPRRQDCWWFKSGRPCEPIETRTSAIAWDTPPPKDLPSR